MLSDVVNSIPYFLSYKRYSSKVMLKLLNFKALLSEKSFLK